MKWYKRTGQQVSELTVKKARSNFAIAKRTGRMGNLRCTVNLDVADRVEQMTLVEFANMSGMFTYRN